MRDYLGYPMRIAELETWVLSVVERALKGQRNEDARVELKSDWPIDAARAARRIAAHCNSARGAEVLWVIGVDEKARDLLPLANVDLAQWWPSVQSQFDGLSPPCTDLVVPMSNGLSVVGLLFRADRPPFVVKNPVFNTPGLRDPVELEVPWRDGTRTRSAKRHELLSVLTPFLISPVVDLIWARVSASDRRSRMSIHPESPDERSWKVEAHIYITPMTDAPVTIPFHTCCADIRLHGGPHLEVPNVELHGHPPLPASYGRRSSEVSSSMTEVHVRAPTMLTVSVSFATRWGELPTDRTLSLDFAFTPALASQPIVIATELSPGVSTEHQERTWEYRSRQARANVPLRRLPNGEYIEPLVDKAFDF